MPDKRITELDAMVDPVAADDVFPFTDVSEDTGSGRTKKLRMDQILPPDGTDGQVLQKDGDAVADDEFQVKWADRPSPQFASLSYRIIESANGINVGTNVYQTIPFEIYNDTETDATDKNFILGLTVTDGVFTLLNGTYLIDANATVHSQRNGGWSRVHMALWKNDPETRLYHGVNSRKYYGNDDVLVTLKRILTVDDGGTGLGLTYSLRTRSQRNGHYIGNETYMDADIDYYVAAQLLIQKLL